MRDAIVIGPEDALSGLDAFDSILDARSPSEYAEDHLPGAVSAPVLSDDERARVGIADSGSAFEARRLGAALVSRNIASLLETLLATTPRDASLLVYCWRGGNRSGALATVLARIGWKTSILRGGYREYRRQVLSDLDRFPDRLDLHVVAGRTGTGKSLILRQLAEQGAQVLDLEQMANHRGSVLGLMPGEQQPSQKRFESLLWHALGRFSPDRPVFVESESRRIGRCHLPDALLARMRSAPCTLIEMPIESRARLLLDEYTHLSRDKSLLFEKLERLVPLHGRQAITGWRELAEAGHWIEFVTALLARHYDPAYDRSLGTNYLGSAPRNILQIPSHEPESLAATAALLITQAQAAAVRSASLPVRMSPPADT